MYIALMIVYILIISEMLQHVLMTLPADKIPIARQSA